MTSGGALNTRQTYYPYGAKRVTEGSALPTDYTFTGQKSDDSTGLMFYNARYYDVTLGRFTQADTMVPNVMDPQSWNRYAYALNNPVRYTDPTGHMVSDEDTGGSPPPPSTPTPTLTLTPTPTPTETPTPTPTYTPTPQSPDTNAEPVCPIPRYCTPTSQAQPTETASCGKCPSYSPRTIQNTKSADPFGDSIRRFFDTHRLTGIGVSLNITGTVPFLGGTPQPSATGGFDAVLNGVPNPYGAGLFLNGGTGLAVGTGDINVNVGVNLLFNYDERGATSNGGNLSYSGAGTTWATNVSALTSGVSISNSVPRGYGMLPENIPQTITIGWAPGIGVSGGRYDTGVIPIQPFCFNIC